MNGRLLVQMLHNATSSSSSTAWAAPSSPGSYPPIPGRSLRACPASGTATWPSSPSHSPATPPLGLPLRLPLKNALVPFFPAQGFRESSRCRERSRSSISEQRRHSGLHVPGPQEKALRGTGAPVASHGVRRVFNLRDAPLFARNSVVARAWRHLGLAQPARRG